MERVVDAQSLISMSLMKIHKSRTQRGGMKLHKNLLVSFVLRSARQVHLKESHVQVQVQVHRRQEVLELCSQVQELDPEDEALPGSGVDPDHMETPVSHCNKTTVLDLDTHVVTTVDGFLHLDCCCAPGPDQNPDLAARKRKGDLSCPEEEVTDFTGTRKRLRWEDRPEPTPDYTDTSNISNLISIFGSGFSGLLSRQADLEQICSKQALASLGVWTRAIVAF